MIPARPSSMTRTRLTLALRADYESGLSIRVLAFGYDLPFATVRRLLLESGVVLRPQGAPYGPRQEPSE